MNDANYPWCILVPDREGIQEIYQLTAAEQQQLIVESSHLSRYMSSCFNPDKMNIAAIGNVVPQLHIHHVARFKDDRAWPQPVWGKYPMKKYTGEESNDLVIKLSPVLSGL
jgi:diadenosine tetraphosphate (Ap4A) HIT family hydrolase